MGAHNTYLHFVGRLILKLCLPHLNLNLQVKTVFQMPDFKPIVVTPKQQKDIAYEESYYNY